MIHSGNLENTTYPVIISYYTIDTVYEEEVKKLISSLENFKLPYQIYGVPTLGSWLNNTGYKAEFVESMLYIVDRPCVWLDADCEVIKEPVLFKQLLQDKVSMGVYIRGDDKNPNLNSSTIYIGNDEFCKQTVEKWVKRMKDTKYKIWDQKCLEHVYLENPNMFFKIPPEYAKKAKMGKKKTSVIFQNNISTETRGSIIDTKIDPLRYLCSHDDILKEAKQMLPKNSTDEASWYTEFAEKHYEWTGKSDIDSGKRTMYDFNPYIFVVNYPEYYDLFVSPDDPQKTLKEHVNVKEVYMFYIKEKDTMNLEKNPSRVNHFESCAVIRDILTKI